MVIIQIILFFLPFSLNASIYEYPFRSSTSQLLEMETENFRIIYSTTSEQKAFETAILAEEEFKSLSEYYGRLQNIRPKIRLIVSSDYQIANGFASVFLYPTIHLYTAIPPGMNDWHRYTHPEYLRTLIRHELTHIFTLSFIPQFQKKNHFYDYFNNLIQPSATFTSLSFIEGSAVSRESDTKQGRLNDPFTVHLARRDIFDNKIPSFSQISGASSEYGSGVYPYLYGVLLNKTLSQQFEDYDINYWKQASKWRISSLANKDISKLNTTQLHAQFSTNLQKLTNNFTNLRQQELLSNKKKRLKIIQQISNRLYYYDYRNKELRVLDLDTKKDSFILYGTSQWDHLSISPDETHLLISGRAGKQLYTLIVKKNTLSPVLRLKNIKSASFFPNSTQTNFIFTGIDISKNPTTLVIFSNNQLHDLYTGSHLEHFDTPISNDGKNIYFLHHYNGEPIVSTYNLHSKQVQKILGIKHPRFLIGAQDSVSISYANTGDDFYKRAIIQNDQLMFIQDNIKGEIFDSVLYQDRMIFKSSFSSSDNLFELPISKFTTKISKLTTQNITPTKKVLFQAIGNISSYNPYPDMVPYFGIPFVSFEKAGLSTILFDSTGANRIDIGLNIEYLKATPEFSFSWSHYSLPININFALYNRYMFKNSVLNLSQHHLLSLEAGISKSEFLSTLHGSYSVLLNLQWLGRFTGDEKLHPYQWDNLVNQQLIGTIGYGIQSFSSEGTFGFNRHISVTILHNLNLLNPKEFNIGGSLSFSPPKIPLTVKLYSIYDSTKISIRGSSVLGSNIMPSFYDYQHNFIFNNYAIAITSDLQLYSWEIQNGVGYGELFFERWRFNVGYRGGYWGQNYDFLQSVYINSHFDFSVLYGNIPISIYFETSYAITGNQWNYNIEIRSSLPISL